MQFIKILNRIMSEVLSLYWIKLLKLEKNYLVTNRITSVYKLHRMPYKSIKGSKIFDVG